ncbi:MAG: hypothetical protein NC041_05310 [Bacteroides sp.]|nr:hypothetical protein [Prevotella sp.]MCM1407374.1 hypothetical protein [Treponema brennaborense]MCM1469864.1 hypothetical protein [Bacteroides sp.]
MHISSRKKEAALIIFSNLTLQVVTALCGFILPPLVISAFGSSVNGMVSSITQFIAYLNIVEAGVGAASVAALYKPLAERCAEGRNAILSAAARFYGKSGAVFVLLVFALSFVYPLAVGTEVDRIQAGLMVLVLGITGAAEFFLIGKYRVLLTADKKLYVISFVQTFAVAVNTAVAAVLIRLGFSILAVKLCSSLVYLSRYAFIVLYCRRKYADLNFKSEPDFAAISQSRNALVHQIGGLVVFNSPLVIIAVLCSLADASVYAVYAMVFSAISNLLGAFSNGMQAVFGESLVKDSPDATRKLFSRFETLFFAAEGWFYAMAYILIMPFMQLYTKNMTDADYIQPVMAKLFVAVGVLNNLRNPAGNMINAAGHFQKTQWRSLAESAINVVFSVAFTLKFGFIGVLLGGICSYAYRTFDIIIYSARKILGALVFISLGKIAVFFALYAAIVSAMRCNPFFVHTYFDWLVCAVISGALLALPCICVFFAVYRRKK